MRDLLKDPKFEIGRAVSFVFREGDRVIKRDDDYIFAGVVIAAFRKRDGSPRYAVENDEGVIHVFDQGRLEYIGHVESPSISPNKIDAGTWGGC